MKSVLRCFGTPINLGALGVLAVRLLFESALTDWSTRPRSRGARELVAARTNAVGARRAERGPRSLGSARSAEHPRTRRARDRPRRSRLRPGAKGYCRC